MPRVYATAEQYEAFTGQPAPANIARLLARASRLVDREMIAAIYDTDPAGFPSDTDVRDAFRDAVSAQAGEWAKRDAAAAGDGDDPTAGPWTSVSAGGLSFSRQSAPVATADDTDLAPEAREILESLALEGVILS
ncbi:hypothetical protein HHX38_08380 [Streptomyces sp. PKU-MA01144]|uniref:hypothetical protein n=1 Tax=Streptomyces sp. PKU-MA01144 TaxID=2729138 RepID=UPI0014809833|nr:hypothetical protein [Streptomyces sp. PKU-MA01144]NNJ04150.1 hypothetical protein [Streptomyces sp. PKU-MA01144]